MNIIKHSILNINNVYFLCIMAAALLVSYFVSVVVNTINQYAAERKIPGQWIVEVFAGPLIMLVLVAGYGIGFTFLTLPAYWKSLLVDSPAILVFINAAWLAINIITQGVSLLFKTLSIKAMTLIRTTVSLFLLLLLVLVFSSNYISLVMALVLGALCYGTSIRLLNMTRPVLREKPIVPKKIVISHIYISTREPHDAVLKAIDLVKAAITETEGVAKEPRVALAEFTSNAFDIRIQYIITTPEHIEQTKEQVNLNIIKKLNESGIKLAGSVTT